MTKGLRVPIKDGHKVCPQCGHDKSLNEYYRADNMYGVRSPCKECIKYTSKERYDQEGSYGKRYNRLALAARSALKRQLVTAVGGKCTRCGYNRSLAALDFHHTEDNKEGTLANLIMRAAQSNGEHMDRAREEAAKCILLCANCHRELHAGEWSP